MPTQSVFQRIEKKYRVSSATRTALEQRLAERLCRNLGRDGLVTSLYLDTPTHQLIGRSLEKPPYKEKLRLRAYGAEAGDALMRAFSPAGARLNAAQAAYPVFLEMKVKLCGVGSKRRLRLPLGVARQFLGGTPLKLALEAFPAAPGGAHPAGRDAQIARELAAFVGRYEALEPSVAVRCQREAWGAAAAEGAAVRVTFDSALEYAVMAASRADAPASGQAEAPCEGRPSWHPLLPVAESIMEVKACGAFPLWLARALSQAQARPQSFSKCGAAARAAFAQPALGKGAPRA